MKKPVTAKAAALTVTGLIVASCCLVAGRIPTPYDALRASFQPIPLSTSSPTPVAPRSLPARTPAPTPRDAPRPAPRADRGTVRVGTATWYCCTRGYGPGDLVAAAGSEIRQGDWRGRRVRVCVVGGGCVSVVLVDWCACRGSRVIDLHPAAFSRLAPLSRGVIEVTVSW